MGDYKMSCPGCNSWTNSIGLAHRDGEPCPECGLPWEAAEAVLAARRRFADDERTKLLEAAEVRAGQAERDRDRHRAALTGVRDELRELLGEVELALGEPAVPDQVRRDALARTRLGLDD